MVSTLICGLFALALVFGWTLARQGPWSAGARSEAGRQAIASGVPATVVENAVNCRELVLACEMYPIASETRTDVEITLTGDREGLGGKWGGTTPSVTIDGVPLIAATTHAVDWWSIPEDSLAEGVTPHVDAVIPAIARSLEGQMLDGQASATVTTPEFTEVGFYRNVSVDETRSVRLLVLSRDQLDLVAASYPAADWSQTLLGGVMMVACFLGGAGLLVAIVRAVKADPRRGRTQPQ
jgi:hypothetical protein